MVANGLTEKVARDKVRTFPYLLFLLLYKPEYQNFNSHWLPPGISYRNFDEKLF